MELSQLKSSNQQIEEEELSRICPIVLKIMQERAEIDILRGQMIDSGQALNSRYDMVLGLNEEQSLFSEFDELAETGMTQILSNKTFDED